jgi:hypothetical protein
MTTFVVHRVPLDEDSDLDEAVAETSFLNSDNEVLRIRPDDRVVPWKEIEKVISATGEDEAVVVRRYHE